MIRETLADLRDIINNASSAGLTFEETLADLRAETAERLAAAGIALDWHVEPGEPFELTPGAAHALRSLVREAVSNTIRHAGASELLVRLHHRGGLARLSIEDDGRGFDPGRVSRGNGLSNMRARIAGLGGKIRFEPGSRGAALHAEFPLAAPARPA